jgi:hypothetical protein
MKIKSSNLIAVIIFTAITMAATGTTWAQLGNRGIPVRCYENPALSPLNPGETLDMWCIAADGTLFNSSTIVPTGYYFLVTDIVIIPLATADTTSAMDVTIAVFPSSPSIKDDIRMRNLGTATFGQHLTVPYLVVQAGYRLQATSASAAGKDALIRVSGLLVNSVNYLPIISR